MSVIFGKYRHEKRKASNEALRRSAASTAPYGPDGTFLLDSGDIAFGYQPFFTHERARLEEQPFTDAQGSIIVFDGRLDNYEELSGDLGVKSLTCPDSMLALKAFQRWGKDCFAKLVGEWALVIWRAADRRLFLARDHAGTRPLHYRIDKHGITWSTYLETFFADGDTPEVEREYVARLMVSRPSHVLTPYKGILSVPAAHFVEVQAGTAKAYPHWNWISNKQTLYQSDSEYDEHFLHLFRQSVQRRIVPGTPILGELSGGMDSSSIVCMADAIRRTSGNRDLIDTISYFDDTEPNWDERPYVAKVEEQRGKRGIHLDCSRRVSSYKPLVMPDRFYPYPGADSRTPEYAQEFAGCLKAGGYRTILSGIGGDEVLGGVPTAMPELADLLRGGHVLRLVQSASRWSVYARQPLYSMLWDALRYAASIYWPHRTELLMPPWLSEELREMCRHLSSTPASEPAPFSARASGAANGHAWWSILETLPGRTPPIHGCFEFRYPYLDRQLVDFLHSVPRVQMVHPGRRRVLMRRALRALVPEEIVERKRKAFLSRGPVTRLRGAQAQIAELFVHSLSAQYGFIEDRKLLSALQAELFGEPTWISHINRAIGIELWLSSVGALRQRRGTYPAPVHRSALLERATKIRAVGAYPF